MLRVNIVCVGKVKESFFRDAILEYQKRLSRYCSLNIIEVPDEKIPDNSSDKLDESIKIKEGKNIISHLVPNSYNISLDLSGKEYDSIQLADYINNLSISNSSITFIIGGSLGLSKEVLDICDYKLSFSKLTFPHQLIRIFLLEQIYRSFKIINNEKYHK